MTAGDVLSVNGFTTGGENPVAVKNFTVVYFGETDGDAGLTADDKIVQSGDTESDRAGDMPNVPGTYYVVVIDNDTITSEYKAIDENTWAQWAVGNAEGTTVYKAQEFTVEPVKISVEGAYAYQGTNKPNEKMLADRVFNYTGEELNVGLAVDNTPIDADVVWADTCPEYPQWNATDGAFKVTEAGTYTAKVKGNDPYFTGETTVTFEVLPATLTADSIEIEPQTSVATKVYAGKTYLDKSENIIYINGAQMAADVPDMSVEVVSKDGETLVEGTTFPNPITDPGAYTRRIEGKSTNNVTGGPVNVNLDVVAAMATYTYNNGTTETTIKDDGTTVLKFDGALGTGFSKDAVKAEAAGKDVTDETTVTVTKDGVEVNDFTTPGVYDVVVKVS